MSQFNEILESILAEPDELNRRAEAKDLREIVDRMVTDAALGGKSGQKISRKARRLFGREAREEGRRIAKNFIKPKPKWVPMWLWYKGIKIFIKVK